MPLDKDTHTGHHALRAKWAAAVSIRSTKGVVAIQAPPTCVSG